MKKLVTLLTAVILLSGCATIVEKQSSSEVQVNKGLPVVYIYPMDQKAYQQASVGVLPFNMPENMDGRLGAGIASMYKDILLGKRIFSTVKLLDNPYGDAEQAISLGRRAGTDMVLAGKVNYILEGTELGGARVDVSVRLLNVNTGNTVWYIGQVMDQPVDYPKTDFVSMLTDSFLPPPIKKSMGAPTVTNMLAQSAVDMADVLGGARYVRR